MMKNIKELFVSIGRHIQEIAKKRIKKVFFSLLALYDNTYTHTHTGKKREDRMKCGVIKLLDQA